MTGNRPADGGERISIKGAREHNLRNIDVDIPKGRLVVITGVSGSGKSSLAFDTLFAEGQRRYVESLSAYARQFIGQMEKPRYETIRGLSPTIAIEQKAASKNPRSTVGTITEIYDYLRVLFARVGTQHCCHCGKVVGRGDAEGMVRQIRQLPEGTRVLLLAPMVDNRKGTHQDLLDRLRREGFGRVRIDGVVHDLADVGALAKNRKHTIDVVVDRLVMRDDPQRVKRLTGSVEQTLRLSGGALVVHRPDGGDDLRLSESRSCCGRGYPELQPQLFSFNSPQGMCPDCNGLGTVLTMDPAKLVPDPSLSINFGAVAPWKNYFTAQTARNGSWGLEHLKAVQRKYGIDFERPWAKLPKKHRDLLLYGSRGETMTVNWESARFQASFETEYEGLVNTLMRRYLQTQSENAKTHYSRFMTQLPCDTCGRRRLRPEPLCVKVADRTIADITAMTIRQAYDFFTGLTLTGNQQVIAAELLREIVARLGFLLNVGLGYLSLEREGPTLSGGESQRIRLASQVGSELTGVLYILDEPSIGLHQRDNIRLLNTLRHLRDIGNSVIVVEHDRETIETADWVIDMGPGAGIEGGEVVAAGTPDNIRAVTRSLTGQYLTGKKDIPLPPMRRPPGPARSGWITVHGAAANNLAGIDVKIPLGLLVAVTGVSGAGKSSLINQILYPALAQKLHKSSLPVGRHRRITGLGRIDKVINIDQKPIGRTPRSNPATYTKVFDQIREVFSRVPESRARGYKKGRFSFNVKGGRCEACRGDGYNKIEMLFLPDVYVACETCGGRRYNQSTLEVRFKDLSIADVLDLSVAEAAELFAAIPAIRGTLDTLLQVGLGYIKLGQSATTLSGGEAQRIKLARELSKRQTGRTVYILDEPTTGLHLDDIRQLLAVLQTLVGAGNTVIVIEHNLDVVKTVDWIVDLGPEGGSGGGRVVAAGTPEAVAECKESFTGRYLRDSLRPG